MAAASRQHCAISAHQGTMSPNSHTNARRMSAKTAFRLTKTNKTKTKKMLLYAQQTSGVMIAPLQHCARESRRTTRCRATAAAEMCANLVWLGACDSSRDRCSNKQRVCSGSQTATAKNGDAIKQQRQRKNRTDQPSFGWRSCRTTARRLGPLLLPGR